ncbi:MAG: YeiH family protein [Chloroflexota bacterium]
MHLEMAPLRVQAAPRALGLVPGLIAVIAIGAVAVGVDSLERGILGQPVIEALVAAIIIGMLVRNLFPLPRGVEVGAGFAAKELLEFAVLLLGLTIDVRQVLSAGPALLLGIAVVVTGGIVFSYLFGRALGLPSKLAVLVAVGNSICGNSAIAAVAPVIRPTKNDVASSIALTALIGVVVVLSLPLLLPLAGLTFYQYGVLAGMTVYAVPQVMAASFPVSQLSGEVAMLVKLLRVLFLGPVVLFFSLADRARGGQVGATGKRPALVPWFIVGFVVLAAVRFTGAVPAPVISATQETSRLLTVLAMAGLGLGVEFAAIRKVGPRVAAAAVGSLVFLISLSLSLIVIFHVAG